jgi:adenylosuccinate lyase
VGLARLLRGNLVAAIENVALWHERDISHSSVERVVLPDSAQLAHYSLRRLARLLSGLQVRDDQMLANLELTRGLVFSQPVLLALVDGGLSRDDAYRIVQEDAARVWAEGRSFREVLDADDRVPLDADALDRAFSLERALVHTDKVFAALDAAAAG